MFSSMATGASLVGSGSVTRWATVLPETGAGLGREFDRTDLLFLVGRFFRESERAHRHVSFQRHNVTRPGLSLPKWQAPYAHTTADQRTPKNR